MKPGDDLSYYLGPSATKATQAQCDEMERTFKDAREGAKRLCTHYAFAAHTDAYVVARAYLDLLAERDKWQVKYKECFSLMHELYAEIWGECRGLLEDNKWATEAWLLIKEERPNWCEGEPVPASTGRLEAAEAECARLRAVVDAAKYHEECRDEVSWEKLHRALAALGETT